MSFWAKQEQEMLLGIRSSEPNTIVASANWPYFVTRLTRCEGFTETHRHEPADGGQQVEGLLDTSDFKYLWLRKSFGSERADREYWQRLTDERAAGTIPETPEVIVSEYRVGANERETTFLARAAEPYWISVETDAALWLRWLEENPYTVLVRETRYGADSEADEAEHGQACRRYLLPRKLLTIRKRRPQYSEEYLEQLRTRLAAARPA